VIKQLSEIDGAPWEYELVWAETSSQMSEEDDNLRIVDANMLPSGSYAAILRKPDSKKHLYGKSWELNLLKHETILR
jgi:hypothetical protein